MYGSGTDIGKASTFLELYKYYLEDDKPSMVYADYRRIMGKRLYADYRRILGKRSSTAPASGI